MSSHQQSSSYYNDQSGQMNSGYHDAPYSHDMQSNRYENLSQLSIIKQNFASNQMLNDAINDKEMIRKCIRMFINIQNYLF